MRSLNGNEAALHIISVRLERDESDRGPVTPDRAVVSYSLDGATVQSATFRWDRSGDDIDSPDVTYPSPLWTELHDAALAYLLCETAEDRRRLARVAYERACAWESVRRGYVASALNYSDLLDGGPTRVIPAETLAQVAAAYYAARGAL